VFALVFIKKNVVRDGTYSRDIRLSSTNIKSKSSGLMKRLLTALPRKEAHRCFICFPLFLSAYVAIELLLNLRLLWEKNGDNYADDDVPR
jgi:hypothetical protein